ncbi:hypothetical protein HOLleu_13540 [Holothuria leucospilota]|uniref:Uncharacterized protein n=1 Tax=Holothuria leucospilota TaxID=206669 RepID=A0A9Q1CCM3_HOLLE|nr:hypothetical protein HOLleu_13540 [Holothuria leucospilota]
MMHILHHRHMHRGRSSVHYLPMIDMYPGDKTCILSTLEFISNLATKHHVPPVVTFDQPLYWKAAAEIISASPENSRLKEFILILGTFYTLMNLLGATDTLMNGTGPKNILEVVYGETAVVYTMTVNLVKEQSVVIGWWTSVFTK